MNARWPIEPHYHLPFLHWLPESLATAVLKTRGYSVGYLEQPLSTPQLVTLVSAFDIHDYTLKVIAQPGKYHARDIIKFPFFGKIYRVVAGVLYGWLPGYLWILKKRPIVHSQSRES